MGWDRHIFCMAETTIRKTDLSEILKERNCLVEVDWERIVIIKK
jgi:hypothetical protein